MVSKEGVTLPEWRRPIVLRPIRNIDGGDFLEAYLVAAVVSILVMRIYLEIMRYPQIGGGGLHIAHVLWGGLLMMFGAALPFALLGKRVLWVSAIVGGVGFGLFIDEVGKFVTSDVNYFFRPAFAIMYVVFVLMFVAIQSLQRRIPLSPEAYLVNALMEMQEVALHDLEKDERDRALRYLELCDQANPLVLPLRETLHNVTPLPNVAPPLPIRIAHAARDLYFRLVGQRWFSNVVIVVAIGYAALLLVSLAFLVIADPRFSITAPNLDLSDIGEAFAAGLSGLMIIIGVFALRYGRLGALRWFKRAVLVSIFIGAIFEFYTAQLFAVVGLMFDLLLLVTLSYMIGEEQKRMETRQSAEPLSLEPATVTPHPSDARA